jgi:predicted transcriptional regulator
MEDLTLKIAAKRYGSESTVVSFRLPKDMLRDIDHVAETTGRTRNEIMTTSLEFALQHMEIVLSSDKTEL